MLDVRLIVTASLAGDRRVSVISGRGRAAGYGATAAAAVDSLWGHTGDG